MFTIIKRWIIYTAAVFLGWISILSAVLLLTDQAPAAIAFFPGDEFIEKLPVGSGIASIGPFWISVKSDEPSLGLNLYRAGALLVLPAGLPGCLPVS